MVNRQLNIQTVVSSLFSENAYIAHLPESPPCIVVDPGSDVQDIYNLIRKDGLQPTAILNTHGHADHILGNAALKDVFPDAPLIIGEGDAFKLTDPEANLSAGYGMPVVSPAADRTVTEGETLDLAGLQLEVLNKTGH